MSDRIDEIRARLDAHNNGNGIYATLEMQSNAPADIAWLLAEVERLRSPKKYQMNVTMVNDGRKY